MAQSRELQRAKALDERRRMMELVKRHGHKSAEEYNAAKAEEFKLKGRPAAQFTAAAHRANEQ
jgi:hypothetical protein